ncbi:MAG: isoamylase early set domain-containing protein [Candidatus Pacebacteria bacterium]|nr:isoamylase early set domain-containing protein [Candidatus Paceibacterota bacterium]
MVIQKKKDTNEITFACTQRPEARKVYLAGDFNGWDPTARRMVKVRDGSFRAKMNLAPGEHEYKFVVDGEWMVDSEAPAQRLNPFGTANSVVRV